MAGRDDIKSRALERLLRENRPISALGSIWCIGSTVVALGALCDYFVAMFEPAEAIPGSGSSRPNARQRVTF
jgi:hypothetical protein